MKSFHQYRNRSVKHLLSAKKSSLQVDVEVRKVTRVRRDTSQVKMKLGLNKRKKKRKRLGG